MDLRGIFEGSRGKRSYGQASAINSKTLLRCYLHFASDSIKRLRVQYYIYVKAAR
jgi:hypothetical protein